MERLIQSLQNKPSASKKTEEPTISTPIAQPSMSLSAIGNFPTIVQPSVFSPNVPVSSPNFPVSSASFSASSPANYAMSSESVSILSSENVSVLSSDILSSASVSVLPSTSVLVSSPISIPMSSSNISVSSPSIIPLSSAITPIIQLQPPVTQKVHMQQLPNIDSSSSPHRSEKVLHKFSFTF